MTLANNPFQQAQKFLVLLLLSAICITEPVRGQSAVTPTEGIEQQHPPKTALDEKTREAASDYMDYLSELEAVLLDHIKYYSEFKSTEVKAQQAYLYQIASKLAKGVYLSNYKQLNEDIEKLNSELRANEKELKKQNKRVYKITRNLRRELNVLMDVQDEINTRLLTDEKIKPQITAYLKKEMPEWRKELDEFQYKMIFFDDSVFKENYNKALNDFNKISVTVPEVKIPSIDTPQTTTIAEPPPVPGKDIVFTRKTGKNDVVRNFTDSVEVLSSDIPITVSSRIGDIRITGWDREMVLVRSEINVSSKTLKRAKELARQVELSVYPQSNVLYVDLNMPSIHTLGTSIDKADLEIMVPEKNNIICNGAHGKISISDVSGGTTISAKYANIQLKDISGSIVITNEMGSVNLANIEGEITIQTTHSPVKITECSGKLVIANAFSAVDITSATGKVAINNSGQVNVRDLKGQLTIVNSNGLVELRDLAGSVTVQNTFQPLILKDIKGSVVVTNKRGLIEAKEVAGSLKVQNQNAPILARLLSGTIDLNNKNGTINVTLNEDIRGPSTIVMESGVVNLSLADDINLKVKITSVDGDIQSAWPLTVDTSGTTQKALLAFGNGNALLKIIGNHATIKLNEVQ